MVQQSVAYRVCLHGQGIHCRRKHGEAQGCLTVTKAPAWQCPPLHREPPAALELPLGQATHDAAAEEALYVPAAQLLHAPAPP
jgi:hypothetical protein